MVLLSARSDHACHGEAELTDEEAYMMRNAVAKLQSVLAGAGYAPR